jgi:DNA-binding MarR family transcriptional regulator
MIDPERALQAEQLVTSLGRLMRSLFTLDPDSPASDLPIAQLRVCSILRDGPRSVCALARELGITASAATQIADRLERSGMIERVSESEDRRVRSLQLTPHGLGIIDAHRERRIARAAEALDHLDSGRRKLVLEAIEALMDVSLAAPPAPAEW